MRLHGLLGQDGCGGGVIGPGKEPGWGGDIDSAIQLKFMCSPRSVNPSPLPPFGTTGQRWRTGKGSSGMQVLPRA